MRLFWRIPLVLLTFVVVLAAGTFVAMQMESHDLQKLVAMVMGVFGGFIVMAVWMLTEPF